MLDWLEFIGGTKTGRQYVLVTAPYEGGTSPVGETAAREDIDETDVEGGYVIAYRLPR